MQSANIFGSMPAADDARSGHNNTLRLWARHKTAGPSCGSCSQFLQLWLRLLTGILVALALIEGPLHASVAITTRKPLDNLCDGHQVPLLERLRKQQCLRIFDQAARLRCAGDR